MSKKHKNEELPEEEFESLIEKDEHREAWEHKHQKDKDYRRKYENDDEEWQ